MIYFIQEKGLFRNRVKIGYTDNLKQRLRQIQNTCPSEIKLLLALPGDTQGELAYQERFADYRLHGEWFKYKFRLRLFIWLNRFKTFEIRQPDSNLPNKSLDKKIEPEMLPDAETKPPNLREEIVLDMFAKGASFNEISKRINGQVGGPYNKEIRLILKRFNDTLQIANIELKPVDNGQSLESVDDSEPEPAAETIDPIDAEISAIMAFVSVRDSGKFSWRKATQQAFGQGKFGKTYTDKLKNVLDKRNVDYSDLIEESSETES